MRWNRITPSFIPPEGKFAASNRPKAFRTAFPSDHPPAHFPPKPRHKIANFPPSDDLHGGHVGFRESPGRVHDQHARLPDNPVADDGDLQVLSSHVFRAPTSRHHTHPQEPNLLAADTKLSDAAALSKRRKSLSYHRRWEAGNNR